MLFYPAWLPLAQLLFLLCPSMFKIDFEVIQHVGSARSMKELICEVENFQAHYDSAWIRRRIRFRISGGRVISVGRLLFSDEVGDRLRPM